ncbi:hypothetical protein Tco_1541520 [Tanacetum coccineum]
MDDPNITMEEYIRLEEEKARRQGQTFDWQIATYGRMEYFEEKDDSFTNLDTEYPAIVFDNTSDEAISWEPTVEGYDEGIIHSYEHRLEMIFRTEVNRVHVLDFAGLTDGMRQTLADRLSMVYIRDNGEALMSDIEMGLDVIDTLCFQLGRARRRMTWRQFILALGLHSEEEMAEAGFGAYWSGSERVIPDKGDLRDYWMEISSDRDFLGLTPSYVYIKDPMRRLCHRMIECSIFGRGQGAKKYLFRHFERRKSGARLSRGHFIGRLAAHFSLVSDEGLRGLSIIARELPVIDLLELARLNICLRFGDTWAWVAQGLERQQAAVAGAPGAADDAPAAHEGTSAAATHSSAPDYDLAIRKIDDMSASGHDASADIMAKADPGKFILRIPYLNNKFDTSLELSLHSDNDDDEIKLEDLTELVKDKGVEAMDLDSPKDDQPIEVSSEEEADIHADTHVETKDTSSKKLKLEKDKAATKATLLTAQPSFPNVQKLTELLVNALKLELTQLITNHDLNASILTELKELPSKVNEINMALGDLKQYMEKLEIKVLVFTSKVAALENIKLNIPAGLLVLPQHVSLINARITKLKVLDALPSPLNRVVKALDRFDTIIKSTSKKAGDQNVPLTDQAGTHLVGGGGEHEKRASPLLDAGCDPAKDASS